MTEVDPIFTTWLNSTPPAYPSDIPSITGLEATENKDASNGYVGLTLYAHNFWNAAKTFLTTVIGTATETRTILLPNASGTLALTTDIVNSRLQSYTTTATATGTTTLTAASNFMQYFTGTLGQIIVMPDVTTLVLGFQFKIINNSTQALTLNSSGGNLIISLAAGSEITLTCILITGTTAASWSKLAEAVNIPASEKAVTIGTTGL